MTNIFAYNDYREYLADYYTAKKSQNPAFSYHNFSRLCGFSSKSFIFNIIKGKKNLSRESVGKICRGLKLTDTESLYFENLVFFIQAKDIKEKTLYLDRLNAVHARDTVAGNTKRLRKDQFSYFSDWYHAVIRSIIDMYFFKDDYKWLAKMVKPAITPFKAKKSVQLLERLDLIKMGKNGYYEVCNKTVSSGREVKSLAVRHYHLKNMELAKRAIEKEPREQRNISGLTLGISEETFKRICDIIYNCQDNILTLAENDKRADRVYHLNFHFYPVSNRNGKGAKK
jgi:uncharacterized protein (TIGR02147 family)